LVSYLPTPLRELIATKPLVLIIQDVAYGAMDGLMGLGAAFLGTRFVRTRHEETLAMVATAPPQLQVILVIISLYGRLHPNPRLY